MSRQRATLFQIYSLHRRSGERGNFAPPVVYQAPRKFRVNPFIEQLTVLQGEPGTFPSLQRFCYSVRTERLYSPASIVQLWMVARLFPLRWPMLVHPRMSEQRIYAGINNYNARYCAPLELGELLEMSELVRYFVRPTAAAAARFEALFGPLVASRSSLATFGSVNDGRSDDNDNYRLALLVVLLRASTSDKQWMIYVEQMRRLGAVTQKTLARLTQQVLRLPASESIPVGDLLTQFCDPRTSFRTVLTRTNKSK
jgi:hypothetical protein